MLVEGHAFTGVLEALGRYRLTACGDSSVSVTDRSRVSPSVCQSAIQREPSDFSKSSDFRRCCGSLIEYQKSRCVTGPSSVSSPSQLRRAVPAGLMAP